jgi:cardiolipin synthase
VRVDDLFDVGAQDGPERVSDRIVTVPNVLSLLRLGALPFVWVDITGGRYIRALVVLSVFAATDWIDGWVARRFDQVSRLGKVLDPISDRILIVVVAIACVVADVVPLWAVALVLLRDVLVGAVGLRLLARGAGTPPVSRAGKTATFALMTAFPFLLWAADAEGGLRTVLQVIGGAALGGGLLLYWLAAWQYATVLRARSAGTDG